MRWHVMDPVWPVTCHFPDADDSPGGEIIKVEAGDMLVLPAGTGHQSLAQSGHFVVIGAYPPGQEQYDICRSVADCPEAREKIAGLPLPGTDPFYGSDGPLMHLWAGS